MCRFFLNGNCRFGEFCRNSHIIQAGEHVGIQQTTESNDATRNWIDAPEFVPRHTNKNSQPDTTYPNPDCEGASR